MPTEIGGLIEASMCTIGTNVPDLLDIFVKLPLGCPDELPELSISKS